MRIENEARHANFEKALFQSVTKYVQHPLKEVEKKYKKIASLENFTSKKMSTGPSLYYEWYGSYGCPKNFLTIKPFKEVEKIIVSLEN